MPGNYTPLYGAESVEHQNEMFSDEQEKVKAIADYVRQRKNGVFEERPLLLNFLLYKMFYAGGAKQIPAAAKGFWITDACTRCGLCAQVCPVENIRLEKGIPVWMDHCQHCLACLQWCPVEAIQYKKSTLGKKRYRHPAVTAQDIMGQR
jgi:ferredoxin